jgi:hypothetical protein
MICNCGTIIDLAYYMEPINYNKLHLQSSKVVENTLPPKIIEPTKEENLYNSPLIPKDIKK